MIQDDLNGASEPVLQLIVEQAEKRLEAQCSFADAQDARATSLLNAAAALEAAALALAGGSFTTLGLTEPLTIGGIIALLGFTAASVLALRALRSGDFHSCGFFPEDFVGDIRERKTKAKIKGEVALDFQLRLVENKRTLIRRGNLINWAGRSLIFTPVAAFVAGLLAAK